jgi:excisionase family DNA binding protein
MQSKVHSIEELPLVLNADDISRVLGLSRVKTYELLHQEGFPTVRIGRVLRVPREGFFAWLNREGDGQYIP